jgi:hypothetical protein
VSFDQLPYEAKKAMVLRALNRFRGGWAHSAWLAQEFDVDGWQMAGLLRSLKSNGFVSTNAGGGIVPAQWWVTESGSRAVALFAAFTPPSKDAP